VPAAVAFAVPWLGWRGAVEGFAAIGLAAAVLVLLALTNLKIGHTPIPIDKSYGRRAPTGASGTCGDSRRCRSSR
jgi:hypothetical protein